MYVTKINSSNLELYRASGYGATWAKLASSGNTTTLSTNTLSFDFKGDRFAFIDFNNKLYVKDGLTSVWGAAQLTNISKVDVCVN